MTTGTILPGQTIGILGGGQLGRMMAIAAKEMGYRIAVLEPKEYSPCGQVADHEVIAAYDDFDGAAQLAKISDVITYEFENIDKKTAEWLSRHAYMPQGSQLLAVTQDRALEKRAIEKTGIAVAPYVVVSDEEDFERGLSEVGFPAVLKTTRGGYDGKGQIVIQSEADNDDVRQLLSKSKCILEKWISFDKELSVIVTRSVNGETTTFPVAENHHVNNILHKSIVPARIADNIADDARTMAMDIANALGIVGTLAVELFLTSDGKLYVNELAPRPHNSGHYTLNACETSQFEQHVRAICGLPLGRTDLLKPVVMVNVLGQHVSKTLAALDRFVDCKLHLYGKDETKYNRKMGHVNVLANTTAEALERIDKLDIWTDMGRNYR